jgi:RsiW-degrading membrane proteinase PrsW (M82 family)
MSLFLKSIYLSSGLSLLYIYLLYRSHPWRRLPATTVTLTFVVGMLAVIPVALLRTVLPFDRGTTAFSAYVSAGLVEETVKFAAMLLTVWRYRFPDAVEPLDFAIFFGLLGVGFGVYEDFWYIFGGSYDLWLQGDLGRFGEVFNALLAARAFPGHILFNGLAGFLIGTARALRRDKRRFLYLVGAFLIAVAAHGTFNLIADVGGRIPLLAYIVTLIGLFVYARQLSASRSPFRALIGQIRGKEPSGWAFPRPPIDYLFTEGFSWPQEGKGGMFQVFPIVLSLVILYPVLFGCVYLMHRWVTWGISG